MGSRMAAALGLGRACVALLAFSTVAWAEEEFRLESPDIGPDKEFSEDFVYDAFGCSGSNQSFALRWSGAPADTQSFAVTTYDPEAFRGKGFWHWFVINIPVNVTELPRDAGNRSNAKLPRGARQLTTNFNKAAYSGPCPPRGSPHNYVVTVYALKTKKVDVADDALASEALPQVEFNALGKATLTFKFGRK